MKEMIRKSIAYQIERGFKNFAIFPFGKRGSEAKKILNEEFGIKEKCIADNELSKYSNNFLSLDELKKMYDEDKEMKILLCIQHTNIDTSTSVHRELAFVDVERLVDVLNPSCYFNPWNRFSNEFITKNAKHHVTECIEREIYYNNISGAVAEAGVFRGDTAKIINYLFPDRMLYLFDTFEGFISEEQAMDDAKGFYNLKMDFTNTHERVVMNKMPFPQNAIIKKGWFPESAQGIDEKFAFVRLDMDLYTPIRAGLEFFYPRMNNGGFIIIHDCRSADFDGARAAVMEFCKANKLNYMTMPDKLGTAVIPIGY